MILPINLIYGIPIFLVHAVTRRCFLFQRTDFLSQSASRTFLLEGLHGLTQCPQNFIISLVYLKHH